MEKFVIDLATSEFAWGTILGVFLSMLASWVNLKLQRNHQQQSVAGFIGDLILSIEDYVEALIDHKERNNVIHREFLDLIDVEIAVWSRNREHMVALEKPEIRKATRQFFNSIATTVTHVKLNLECFHNAFNLVRESTETNTKYNHIAAQDKFFSDAHNGCLKLQSLIRDFGPLKNEVLSISKSKIT